ncbi:MAG: hypothetical protein R3C97_05325 [Geminicoccaceae bacterium]
MRDKVLTAWKTEQQQERAMENASAIIGRVAGGATLEAVADELGDAAVLTTSEPVRRGDNPALAGLTGEALAKLFELGEGEVANEAIAVSGGGVIIRNDAITPAEKPDSLDDLKNEIARQQRNDMLVQYEQALRSRYPVQIDEAALSALAVALSPEQ